MKLVKNLLVVAIAIFAISCESHKSEHSMGENAKLSHVKVDNKLDPVCGMETSTHLGDTLTYQARLYGFCSSKCKGEFSKNPSQYLDKK